MTKKWLILPFILILLAGLLPTGCTNSKKEQVTVTFSYPPFGYDSNLEDAYWKKYIAEFEKEYPGIKIEMTVESWDTVDAKWNQALQSGVTADIGYESPGTIIDYSSQGKILPVTDVVNKLGGESAFVPSMHFMKNGDDWYAVPNCDACKVLMYRKDILKAAGYDNPPSTWDELVEIAKACTRDGTYGLGFYMIDMFYSAHDTLGFMKAAGGEMLDANKNLVLDSSENLEALRFISDLVNVHKVVSPNAVSWAYGDLVSALGTGKIAMAIEWGGFGTLLETTFPDEYQNIGFAKLPDGPSGHSGSFSGMGGFFIFSDAKHPEEAKKFIEFMSRAEISIEWCKISGNVSPFVAVASDPELNQMEWYKAMAEQSSTAVLYGWDYGNIPGSNECQVMVQKAFVDITSRGISPEEAIKTLQQNAQEAIDAAAKQTK